MKIKFTFIALFTILFACSQQSSQTVLKSAKDSIQYSPLYKDAFQKKWVDSIYQTLSLDQKIGQLFIVAAYSNQDKTHEDAIMKLVKEQQIGGLIFMQDNAYHQIELLNEYQKNAHIPLLIGMDAEWGLRMRLKNVEKFPYAMTLGAITDNLSIERMGEIIAKHCKMVGANWNFSPVIDVNTNPKNPIIGNRSFGSDVENVSDKGIAYMNGLQKSSILTSAKHFPGHGDTSTDSHLALPIVDHDSLRLSTIELMPYKNLIKSGVTGIMVAHLDVPYLDNSHTPSSLSYKITTEKLKEELGFKGLIITDALNMQAVASQYPPGIVDVNAFKAGNDVLLFSQNVQKAKEEILKALEKGEITEARIEESVKKILMAKYYVEAHTFTPLNNLEIIEKINSFETKSMIHELHQKSMTVIQNQDDFLPFKNPNKSYYYIGMGENDDIFETKLKKYFNIKKISPLESNKITQNAEVIIGIFKNTQSPYNKYELTATEKNTIEKISKNNKVALLLFTSPYALKNINVEQVKSIVLAYENNEYTQNIVPDLLSGVIGAEGQLPVTIDSNFMAGKKIETKRLHILGYDIPENVGMNSYVLNKIDSIANQSIANKETPGMQVVVAKKGKIVFAKPYGFYTYEKKIPVTLETVYDLASVTKILATLPFIMQLEEKKAIDLEDPLSKHYKMAYETNKANLKINELLLHQSGLKSWIPFYKDTLDKNGKPKEGLYKNTLTEKYNHKVSEGLYSYTSIKDTLYDRILSSDLENKKYIYSDLGFYLLQKIVEQKYRKPLDELFQQKIATPLYLQTLGFNPLNSIEKERIAPTENDNYFRNRMIQGHVHDSGAAIMGGVAGHAGLFGNALEVTKLLQMYLNGGYYGDYHFISPQTVEKFAQYPNSLSRRALGFDKQKGTEGPFIDYITNQGFGHTGFTGIMVWVDPIEELIYVFLSNRTYPSADTNLLDKNKTRVKIQKIMYESISN